MHGTLMSLHKLQTAHATYLTRKKKQPPLITLQPKRLVVRHRRRPPNDNDGTAARPCAVSCASVRPRSRVTCRSSGAWSWKTARRLFRASCIWMQSRMRRWMGQRRHRAEGQAVKV